jgi:hypothetical protein
MDQRQRSALRLLFQSKCHNRYVLMEEESSEICILDLDAFGGEQLWQEFRQRHPQRPLILVSLNSRELTDERTLFIQKPIPVMRLIAAIDQHCRTLNKEVNPEFDRMTAENGAEQPLSTPPAPAEPVSKPVNHKIVALMNESLEKTFIGTSPDIDPNDPAQLAKIYYNPEHYLQGHMQQALNLSKRYNKNVAVEGPWPAIDLMIERQRVFVDCVERQLRPYCTVPDATLDVALHLHEQTKPTTGRKEYSMYAFLWRLALWASRGRLPAGTSLTQPIYLRRWPNFTRLVVTPYALAIASLWAKQPRSLIDTASSLNIPQRYVFSFYSAAKAVHLAGETRRAVDTLLAPPDVKKSRHRGLFSHLIYRLRGNKDES